MSNLIDEIKSPGKNKPILIVGGVIGAVVVYVAYKRSKLKSASTVVTDPSLAANPDDSYYNDGDYSAASGGAVGVTPTSSFTPSATNATWTQGAATYLQSFGYDGTAVLSAIGKYLNGDALTQDEYDIVQAAIGAEGNPPTGAPTPHLATNTGQSTPPPTPAAPAAAWTGDLIRDSSTGAIFATFTDGTKKWIDPAEYANLLSSGAIHQSNGQPYTDFNGNGQAPIGLSNPTDYANAVNPASPASTS